MLICFNTIIFLGSYIFGSTLNNGKNQKQLHMQNLKQNIKIPKVTSNSNNILHLLNEISLSNNAPSIPSKNQSYGYEVEEYSGKLILQDMDIPGYKGTKGDTVGPGDYNPNHESIMKNRVKASFTVRINFIF